MKRVIKIINIGDEGFDAKYWSTKTSQERIAALEHLRNQYLTKNGTRQRLQRVCRIIKR
jgi:hypothetical protein